MKLTWWEWQQLEEHLLDRSDIWDQSGNLFQRCVDDIPVVGIVVGRPATYGKYTLVSLQVVPLAWDVDRCNTYIVSLATRWTTYGHRLKIAKVLLDELKVEPRIADLMAIALEYINHVDDGGIDPEARADVALPEYDVPGVSSVAVPINSYQLLRGGYVSLTLVNGRIRARVSVPSHDRYGGGYGEVLEGTLRTTDGQDLLRAAMLAGWDTVVVRDAPLREADDHGAEQPGPTPSHDEARDHPGSPDPGVRNVEEQAQ